MSVRFERVGSAAVLTIDRPERRNAIDGATAESLLEAFRRFERDPDARVLVVTGAGDHAFSAGADLKALDSLAPRVGCAEGVLGFTRLFASKPTIAAIEGWCVAGGLVLALWCDMRVAGRTARFGFPDRKWGVPVMDGGIERLRGAVGTGRAYDLVMTGRTLDAAEAERIGLVGELAEPGTARSRALEIAEELAVVPQETLLADRERIGRPLQQELERAFAREVEVARRTAEAAARGVASFGKRA